MLECRRISPSSSSRPIRVSRLVTSVIHGTLLVFVATAFIACGDEGVLVPPTPEMALGEDDDDDGQCPYLSPSQMQELGVTACGDFEGVEDGILRDDLEDPRFRYGIEECRQGKYHLFDVLNTHRGHLMTGQASGAYNLGWGGQKRILWNRIHFMSHYLDERKSERAWTTLHEVHHHKHDSTDEAAADAYACQCWYDPGHSTLAERCLDHWN